MFENATTTKKQGTIGLASAILYFTTKNYAVSIPINDSQPYDLVVDIDNILYTVEVKTTSYKDTKSTNYSVDLRGRGSGGTYNTVKETGVDFLFILTKENDKYLIPCIDFENKTSITLSSKFDKYKV